MAKENGLKPFNYLTYIFEKLPNVDIKDLAVLDDLLPRSPNLSDHCRMNKKN
jgi:transposase